MGVRAAVEPEGGLRRIEALRAEKRILLFPINAGLGRALCPTLFASQIELDANSLNLGTNPQH